VKRLIVCCDGTWNSAEQEDNGVSAPTNVVKIYNAIADVDSEGVRQEKYYHPGVGGEDIGPVDAVLGGAVGLGLGRHIRSAYHWLGNNYEEGDEIYLFGFSRGAFTVRSLGGMLSRGLLDLHYIPSKNSWSRVKKVYDEGYRNKDASLDDWADPDWAFFHNREEMPIHFIGVWDTVGALGVPDDLEIFNIFDDKKKWQFHDTSLGGNVKHARHAMAIDEMRSCFCVTRWENAIHHPDAVELWFPGVHSDVGGGYAECDLSNGALKWMITESGSAGLGFRDTIAQTIQTNPSGVMHNSYRGAFAKLRSRPRNIPVLIPQNHQQFHESAIKRQEISPIEHPLYHPTKLLEIGESVTVNIFADTHWNPTHIYLQKDHIYSFSAKGEWKDWRDSCDWRGTEDGHPSTGDVMRAASSFLGRFEKQFKKLTDNQSTDFLGTKRVENLKWFTMVGAITNDTGSMDAVGNDGSPVPHQYIDLTEYKDRPLEISVTRSSGVPVGPGYLYCFPNDVWSLYGNNHGSIQLTVTRLPSS